jgi:hypothetical protein
MSFVERRGYERIEYPPGERPVLLMAGRSVEVLDCSERGLRYALDEAPPHPEIGTELRGRVRFPPGNEVEIEGAILRVQLREVAVLFTTQWIPREVIVSERWRVQRFAPTQPTDNSASSRERTSGD